MWQYKVFVAVCIIKSVHLAETATKSPTSATLTGNKKTPSISASNTDADREDYYYPVSDWSDTFDWQLLKAVSAQEKRNVLISPLSIKLALVMLYEGSEASTAKQFQSIMQFSADKMELREKYKLILNALKRKTKEHKLNIGTRIFLEADIKPSQQYAATIKHAYDTDIAATNFSNSEEASRTINSWVANLTDNNIKGLISPDEVANDVLLVVANAVFFKGKWLQQFFRNNSHTGGFYVSPTDVIQVPYMSNTGKYYYGESKELDVKILRLPYEGKQFSMFLVLPNSKGGLPELMNNINLAALKRQLYLIDERTVDVVIPKFRFDYSSSFTKILQDYGLNIIFSNTASFPGIARGVGSGSKWLFVNDIKQKAGIDIDEEGSTIYAATEIQLGNKFGEADLYFNATHPFLLFVEEQTTGTILFAGKIENPLQTEASLPSRFGVNDGSSATPLEIPVTLSPPDEEGYGVVPLLVKGRYAMHSHA